MSKKVRKPALVHHKPSAQARVRIDGKDHYLGPFGSQEAFDAYDELIREWLLRQDTGRLTIQVDDLCLLYVAYAREHYRKGGEETSEVHCIQLALRQQASNNAPCATPMQPPSDAPAPVRADLRAVSPLFARHPATPSACQKPFHKRGGWPDRNCPW